MLASAYIDALRKALNVNTDSDVGRALEVTQQQMSRYRKNLDHFGDDVALRVGALLNLPPLQVMADAQAHRAKSDEVRRYWERVATLTRRAPATLAVSLCVAAMTAPVDVADSLYIMSTRVRHFLRDLMLKGDAKT